jgi:hypothetical protein
VVYDPHTQMALLLKYSDWLKDNLLRGLLLAACLWLAPSSGAQSAPGNALFIAGTVNYVAVPHVPAFNSFPITVMAWVNTSVTTGQQGLVNKYVANSRNGWNLFLLNGRARGFYFVNASRNASGGADGLDGGFIADGRWHHVALVVDAAGARIYVDGTQRSSVAWTGPPGAATTTQQVRIGSYPNGNNNFVGSIFIDDVRVWNESLTVSGIQNSMDGNTPSGRSNQLAYYPCNEGSGNTVADNATLGGSNNGTWVGLSLFTSVLPSSQTLAATSLGFTQATLNGLANPSRSRIAAGFQWGRTTNFDNARTVLTTGGPRGNADQPYSLALTDLAFDATYVYRAFSSNSATGQFGVNQTFRTPSPAQTLPATSVQLTSARLNGAVTPIGTAMTAWFEWGPTTNYGNLTPPLEVPNAPNAMPVSADIAGAFQGQTIHYRLVATNQIGRGNGVNQNFAIPAFPDPAGIPPRRSSHYAVSQGNHVVFEPRADWDRAVAMTIEAWVYPDQTNRLQTLVSHDAPGSYWLGFSPRLRFSRGTDFVELPRIVPARKWTHVAVTYDGTAARFYLNGELAGTQPLAHAGAGQLRQLRIGHDQVGPTNDASIVSHFEGELDEIRLWSVARSESEIREGLYREVRNQPELAAVFPRGGRLEEISGLVGSGGPPTEQILGMLPRDLVVPRSPVAPIADGGINLGAEYAGADQLVIRYPDLPAVSDNVAYFIRTDDNLFVAFSLNGRAGFSPNTSLSLFIDTTNGRPALAEFPQIQIKVPIDGDTNHTSLLSGDGLGGYFACLTPPNLGPSQPCTPRSLWQATQVLCGDDVNQSACVEFRVSRTLLGSFNDFDGVAIGISNLTGTSDSIFTPEEALPAEPTQWVTMTYGDGSATLPRVRWNGRIFASPTKTSPPLANHSMFLFANDIAHSTRSDSTGRFRFDVPMPAGQTIRGQPGTVSFALQGRPLVCTNCLPNDIEPLSVFTNGVLYPALPIGTTGVVQLASADFFLQPPPGIAAITGASPLNPQCGAVVRQGEPGGPGERVTLSGTNLHGSMEFFLAPVSPSFPNSPAAWTLLPAAVKSIAADGKSVEVEAPFVPETVQLELNGPFVLSFDAQTAWRWVAHDTLFRPGRIEYSTVGDFRIQRPPYPITHGFRFDNQGASGRLNEFLACYGQNAYIGECPACVPDPLYWGIWFPVYDYWMEESGGSCVGMASTAVQLFNDIRQPVDFDPDAFFANGILDPGFPGDYDTSNFGGRNNRPPKPKDVWAVIRANHGAQTSLEYLTLGLAQSKSATSLSGFPTARLNEMRGRLGAYTICMQRADGGGHCVTPYRIEDNFTNNANHSRIWVYDNEKPCEPPDSASSSCVTGAFIDFDLSADKFTFGGETGDGIFAIPVETYSGRRTAPIALLGAIGPVFEIPQLLMFIAGGADAHYSSPQGEWGWRPDGQFVDNLPGLRAMVPLGSATNRTHSIPVFLQPSDASAYTNLSVQMNVRSSRSSFFHVSDNGISLQMESTQGSPGHANQIRLGTRANRLSSFRYIPHGADTNFTTRVGMLFQTNSGATFEWKGLRSEGNRAQEFRALRDRRAVEYCNESTQINRHSLRIDAVAGSRESNASTVYGPFDVPPGAIHCVVLHEWPRVKQVRSELDLNADGTPDEIRIVTGIEVDTDSDGLPDAWETRNQLDPEVAAGADGPEADPDRDGMSNLGEYLSDTDPRDPLSALRLTAALLPEGQVRLTWHAVPGRSYDLLYADALAENFRQLPGEGFPRIATSTEEHFNDTGSPRSTKPRFYRLRLAP